MGCSAIKEEEEDKDEEEGESRIFHFVDTKNRGIKIRKKNVVNDKDASSFHKILEVPERVSDIQIWRSNILTLKRCARGSVTRNTRQFYSYSLILEFISP